MPTTSSITTQSNSLYFYLGYTCSTCNSPIILKAKATIAVSYSDLVIDRRGNRNAFETGYNDGISKLSVFLDDCRAGKKRLGFLQAGYNYGFQNSTVSITIPAITCKCPLCGSNNEWQLSKDKSEESVDIEGLPKLFTDEGNAVIWLYAQHHIQKLEADSKRAGEEINDKVRSDREAIETAINKRSALSSKTRDIETQLKGKKAEYINAHFKTKRLLKEEIASLEKELSEMRNKCAAENERIKKERYNYRFDTILLEGYSSEPLSLQLNVLNKKERPVGYTVCLALGKTEKEEYYGEPVDLHELFAIGSDETVPQAKVDSEPYISEKKVESTTYYCQKCGYKLDTDERFCRNCGAPISAGESTIEKQDHRLVCYQCGELLDPDELFCHKCGASTNCINLSKEIKKRIKNQHAKLRRAFIFLQDKEWERADSYFEKILEEEPENAYAYFGKIMVALRINDLEEIQETIEEVKETTDYKHAVEFGDDLLHKFLEAK